MGMIFLGGEIAVVRHLVDANPHQYRDQVNHCISLCSDINLELNANKIEEIIVDFNRNTYLLIDGRTVEIVKNFKFLGSVISSNLEMGAKY